MFNGSPQGTEMGNASSSSSPCTRQGRIFLIYIPMGGNKLLHSHPLMEEFPAGNWGSRLHCHLYTQV
jgi:hypothetical protein